MAGRASITLHEDQSRISHVAPAGHTVHPNAYCSSVCTWVSLNLFPLHIGTENGPVNFEKPLSLSCHDTDLPLHIVSPISGTGAVPKYCNSQARPLDRHNHFCHRPFLVQIRTEARLKIVSLAQSSEVIGICPLIQILTSFINSY